MKNGNFNTSPVYYVENKNIDRTKCDKCINDASNGTIYALSFYLDALSKNWSALVMKDYETVMPLIWNKKYWLYYLYQPYFLRHTGIFGKNIHREVIKDFLSSIPEYFKYWDIDFKENTINPNDLGMPHLDLIKRRNFFLDIGRSYE